MRNLLFIVLTALLSACSSINYIGIETYNPAEVTFPKDVNKLLIVNNAVAQPDDWGYKLIMQGKEESDARAKADSALFDACKSLGKAIVDASFFNDVLLYNHGYRQDKNVHIDAKLTAEQVADLCEETGADAVISVDRLLFNMKKDVTDLGVYVTGIIDVKMDGVVRTYLPGRELPIATVHYNDSTSWGESAETTSILNKILPTPEEALRISGEYFGLKIYSNFVPHWQKETRWYYSDIGSRWKEASAYAEKEKWAEAEIRWNTIYKNSKKGDKRAKSASNLALCCEMKGDLVKALEWATISYDLFKENKKDKENASFMEVYVKVLTERIQRDKKLNIQFGKE